MINGSQQKKLSLLRTALTELAEVDENRTHQGRDAPPIGFEDREPHQRTNYLRSYYICAGDSTFIGVFLQPKIFG